MCHINSLRKWESKHLVSQCDGLIYNMHGEPAGIFIYFFKFKELQLNTKRCILHFKSANDFLLFDDFMDHSMGLEYHITFGVPGLKLPAAMFFVFEFQHFGAHPLFKELRLYICLEQQV